MYISGVNFDAEESTMTKLLGVPEVPNSTGSSQEKAVMQLIADWDLESCVVGLVFDTTSSNSGIWRGACTLIEQRLGKATLWIACRHHIYELHIKHVCDLVTGNTKDPGVKLFRRLKKSWNSLQIDLLNLITFDYNTADKQLINQAQSVLEWGLGVLDKNVFPRDDYKELIQLIVVWIGGPVKAFSFKFPGADHHARWMSKAIYFMKLALVQKQFVLDPKETVEVNKVAEFVGLFYGKAFLMAPLCASAANNDINFMNQMLMYSRKEPQITEVCIALCKRHLWYVTPQLLPFMLCDALSDELLRKQLAQKLISLS